MTDVIQIRQSLLDCICSIFVYISNLSSDYDTYAEIMQDII